MIAPLTTAIARNRNIVWMGNSGVSSTTQPPATRLPIAAYSPPLPRLSALAIWWAASMRIADGTLVPTTTQFGGFYQDFAKAITYDAQGNIYVAGDTASKWGKTPDDIREISVPEARQRKSRRDLPFPPFRRKRP